MGDNCPPQSNCNLAPALNNYHQSMVEFKYRHSHDHILTGALSAPSIPQLEFLIAVIFLVCKVGWTLSSATVAAMTSSNLTSMPRPVRPTQRDSPTSSTCESSFFVAIAQSQFKCRGSHRACGLEQYIQCICPLQLCSICVRKQVPINGVSAV